MKRVISGRFPTELADLCVKCGLCLPHCPTYALSRNEGDSPRGRISLMQGLADGQLAASDAALGHLDRCLSCRNCERVCPAEVPFGQLMDAARESLTNGGPVRDRSARLSAWVLARPRIAGLVIAGLRLARSIGLLGLLARTGPFRLRRLMARIPRDLHPWQGIPLAPLAPAGEAVQIFTGCLTPLTDAVTLENAIRVLSAMNFRPVCKPMQACCGGLYLHAGAREQAIALAKRNSAVFSDPSLPVIGLASGCTATLSEYPALIDDADAFAVNVYDIISWVARHADRLPRLSLPETVSCVVHDACTLRNVLRGQEQLGPLLDRIEKLSWRPLNPPQGCCGAAGAYMLSQPVVSDALAAAQVAALAADPPDLLLTTNIGCALQLQAACDALKLGTRVLHPISLIARALPGGNGGSGNV